MLRSLHIVNFAIIEDTWIEFGPGATVFTGETGAGKSILMEALAILLGKRASAALIRHGEKAFRVEGVFTKSPEILPLLEEMGLDDDEDELIIARKMSENGRGACTVNGMLCTVKQLEKLGGRLVKLHEQNDNAELLSPDFCRYLIDRSSPGAEKALADYTAVYTEWKETRRRLDDFQNGKQARERRLDILQWEIDQIERADITDAAEDEAVEKKLTVAENQEKIHDGLGRALENLAGDAGAQNTLAEAVRAVGTLTRYDPSLSEIADNLQNALYAVEEAIGGLEDAAGEAEFSEAELAALQERDETLSQLKAKYGPTLADVLSYLENARREWDELQEGAEGSGKLAETFARLTEEVRRKADALNAVRAARGKEICAAITKSLRDMEMENAVLALHIEPAKEPTASGAAAVEFYFSANPGEPLKPMRQVASGGEISRISLALEGVLSDFFKAQTLVFDEIDTGISGSAALKVARKIRSLSRDAQVLCITHMPQTASIADTHYHIRKSVADGKTSTRAALLSKEEHILDIAWMISGNRPPKESAIQAARDLTEAVFK